MDSLISSQPLVSILINNYNYGHLLTDAINSALAQNYGNVEVIVVDDGSTDNSKDLLEPYKGKITSVLKANGGQASAMNAGFAVSKGEIVCFLDADDLFLPERLTRVVDIFQTTSNIDWVFTESMPVETSKIEKGTLNSLFDSIRKDSDAKTLARIDFRTDLLKGKFADFLPSTSNLCFSRKILEKIFPLPEIKGLSGMAITDLYIKNLAIGLSPGCVTKENLGIYRFHDNYYSNLDIDKKRKMFGEIYTTTGYWIQKRFPEFKSISQRIVTKGFATYLSSKYVSSNPTDADCPLMFESYMRSLSLPEKLQSLLFLSYYRSRLAFKDFV
ncbi:MULTISPECIES: glycosyltransferase family 2 protein [Cyanophyceae]|uniref:Glycosyltransferase family 2 protein n=1 Tax=Leptolyngbya subtilissima DQ-A4 TaxID=2933933 RepID=A0ABV0JZ42_9CYAN|nr:glycosyltransferase family 2 protein [Nodosilinea sp. FACHB-141]MBD2112387.1 glycosyltransferase family 2 protein [Nodosilinea sp. FACHB-141]